MIDYLKHILSSRQKKLHYDKNLKPAAVLVPLFSDGEELHILFTRRSEEVFHHKGQISFPGGRPHEKDSDLRQTALRESWEEIGLKPEDVRILGELDDTPTVTTGFNIRPFVGIIPFPYSFKLNKAETTALLDIPFQALLDDSAYSHDAMDSEGIKQAAYVYHGQTIWGATARIVKQLVDILRDPR
jgi:8-oxo-dGTP pyrophosphatase MutT (NUDIX family)